MALEAKNDKGCRVTPAELERALRADDAAFAIGPRVRAELLQELLEVRWRLRAACSQAWFDHCWLTGAAFPPAADTTPMRPCGCERCRASGRLWPQHYDAPDHAGAAVLSYECYLESLGDEEAANLPSSPSGIALRAIREGRIRLRFPRTSARRRR